MTINSEIRNYYEQRPEESRHLTGPSQLEAARTRALISEHAPSPPGIVLDVGGAAGAYGFWLAELGYSVHLLDPVDRLIREAERRNADTAFPLQGCQVGDARALPYADNFADFVLLIGPLYHLTAPQDRAAALSEAARVLKPGGVLFAGAISRWASAFDSLARDLFVQPDQWTMVEGALVDGQHRNLTGRPGGFTTAYFHRPEELREELLHSGLETVTVLALEGLAGFLPDFDQRWADPRQRANILRIAEALQAEPMLLGATPHLLAIGRKSAFDQ